MNIINTKKINFHYILIQSTYQMIFCASVGYSSVFLLSKDFTVEQTGFILAIANLVAALLQPIVAVFSDKTKRIALNSLIAVVIVIMMGMIGLLIIVPNSFVVIGVLFIMVFALSLLLQPLLNAISFAFVNRGVHINFGLARGLGSLSYAIISWVLGKLVQKYSGDTILYVAMLLSVIILVLILGFKTEKCNSIITEIQKRNFLIEIGYFFCRYRKFMWVILGSVCLFTHQSFVYTYMIKIVETAGGNTENMGTALSIGAIFEIPTMVFFSFLVLKIKCGNLMKISAFFFAVKAVLLMLANNIGLIYFNQTLQLLSFALFIPASVYYVNMVMEEKDRIKGQAIMTMTNTVGGTIGSLSGGWIIQNFGVKGITVTGAVLAIIGACLVIPFTENIDLKVD